jgi:hypothetical protein
MRKHRLSGVVIATLIALGAFTQRSDVPHRTPGTDRAGMQLASARLPARPAGAPRRTTVATVATDAPAATLHALLDEMAGHAGAVLASPFGTQALVWDVRVAQLTKRAEVSAYLAAVHQQTVVRAYLAAMALDTAARQRAAAVAAAPPDPWPALRQCESDGNYGADSGNGYYGAYQFNISTWRSLGLDGLPSQAAPAEQDRAAQELQARRGWAQWPSCARRLGLI